MLASRNISSTFVTSHQTPSRRDFGEIVRYIAKANRRETGALSLLRLTRPSKLLSPLRTRPIHRPKISSAMRRSIFFILAVVLAYSACSTRTGVVNLRDDNITDTNIGYLTVEVVRALETRENEFTLAGQVLDRDRRVPLLTVNVYIAETNRGTATNEEGYFELDRLHMDQALVFAFIGYKTDTLSVRTLAETERR